MEQEAERYLEMATKGLDVAQKSGILKRLFSFLPSRQSKQATEESMDYHERALEALRDNAIETLAGLTLTVGEAAQILESGFTLDDLDKVNSTWQRHWTGSASKVGIDDNERRTWWARLLAGEIQQPETYSLRTLAVMDTLSTKEARLFTRLCDYVWSPIKPVLILPTDESALWKPEFSDGTLLESAGLVKFDEIAGFIWGTMKASVDDKESPRQPKYLSMAFKDDTFLIEIPESEPVKLRCGSMFLTDIGQEIYRLIVPNYPQAYRDEIVEEWRKSYNVRVEHSN